jgi:hypothetical protein
MTLAIAKWRPEKHELLHFLLRLFWIKIYGLNNQEHHLLNAIKVVEKLLKAFLKAMTYY